MSEDYLFCLVPKSCPTPVNDDNSPAVVIDRMKPINPTPVIRMTDANVNFTVINDSAEVTINQAFRNDSSETVEAIYYYPLDSDSAVRDFFATFDGKTIRGKCMEKVEAKRTYEEAKKQGKKAALAEELRSDIGRITVGNVKPGSEVIIRFVFVRTLTNSRFSLPATIGQRFNRTDPAKLEDRSENGHVVINKVRITGTITMSEAIDHIMDESLSGVQIKVKDFHNAIIDFHDVFNKDISLRIFTKTDNSESSDVKLLQVSELNSDDGCLLFSFVPKIPDNTPVEQIDDSKQEIAFIVDRSGSMDYTCGIRASGYNPNNPNQPKETDTSSRIYKVRVALTKMLEMLHKDHPKSSFNIISFGNESSSFTRDYRFKECDEDNIKMALEHINTIKADMGGTEIHKPIEHAMNEHIQSGVMRNIIILTDGDVNDFEDILTNIKNSPHRNNLRFFTLGIGAGVSSAFIKQIAHVGGGVYDFVHDSDTNFSFNEIVRPSTTSNPSPAPRFVGDTGDQNNTGISDDVSSNKSWGHKMNRLYRAIFSPRINNFRIETNMTISYTSPKDIQEKPNMMIGERFNFFALVSGVNSNDSNNSNDQYIRLCYDANNVACRHEFKINLSQSSDYLMPKGRTLHCMLTQNIKTDLRNDELLKLCLRYNLMSRLTSFVAVDEEEFTNPNAKPPVPAEVVSNYQNERFSERMKCAFSIQPMMAQCSMLKCVDAISYDDECCDEEDCDDDIGIMAEKMEVKSFSAKSASLSSFSSLSKGISNMTNTVTSSLSSAVTGIGNVISSSMSSQSSQPSASDAMDVDLPDKAELQKFILELNDLSRDPTKFKMDYIRELLNNIVKALERLVTNLNSNTSSYKTKQINDSFDLILHAKNLEQNLYKMDQTKKKDELSKMERMLKDLLRII